MNKMSIIYMDILLHIIRENMYTYDKYAKNYCSMVNRKTLLYEDLLIILSYLHLQYS